MLPCTVSWSFPQFSTSTITNLHDVEPWVISWVAAAQECEWTIIPCKTSSLSITSSAENMPSNVATSAGNPPSIASSTTPVRSAATSAMPESGGMNSGSQAAYSSMPSAAQPSVSKLSKGCSTGGGTTTSVAASYHDTSAPLRAHTAAIVGGVIGGLLVILLLSWAVWNRRRQRRLKTASSAELMSKATDPPLGTIVPQHSRDTLHESDRSGAPLPPFAPGPHNDHILENAWRKVDGKQSLKGHEDDENSAGGYESASVEAIYSASPSHLDHIGEAF